MRLKILLEFHLWVLDDSNDLYLQIIFLYVGALWVQDKSLFQISSCWSSIIPVTFYTLPHITRETPWNRIFLSSLSAECPIRISQWVAALSGGLKSLREGEVIILQLEAGVWAEKVYRHGFCHQLPGFMVESPTMLLLASQIAGRLPCKFCTSDFLDIYQWSRWPLINDLANDLFYTFQWLRKPLITCIGALVAWNA